MTTYTTAKAGRREWAGLCVLALPMLLAAVDNSVLFLALPHLTADLRPSATQVLWIMDAYGFMMAGLLITMGTLGDRIGRRRLLVAGAAAFGAASLLAAYATTAEMLIAARMLLGVSAAALAPTALALVGTMFAEARQRALAIGVFTACFMGGAALGPVVGGVLLENFWWGSVFLLGVPVAALLLVTAPLLLPDTPGSGSGRLDPGSVALSLAAVIPVVYGLKELADEPSAAAPGALAVGAVCGALFVRRQLRLPEPLLDLRLFRSRSFSAALVILLLTMVLQGGSYYFFSQHLQLVEGLSPLTAGLWMAPPALALVVGSLLAPVLARTVRPGVVVAAGLVVAAGGFAVVAVADTLGLLVAGCTVAFAGSAPVGALGLNLVVGAAPGEKAGSASAVAESSGELGISFGIATLGSLGAAVYMARVDLPAGAPERAGESLADAVAVADAASGPAAARLLEAAHAAFGSGFSAVAVVCAVLSAGLAVLAAGLLRHLRPIGDEEGSADS